MSNVKKGKKGNRNNRYHCNANDRNFGYIQFYKALLQSREMVIFKIIKSQNILKSFQERGWLGCLSLP